MTSSTACCNQFQWNWLPFEIALENSLIFSENFRSPIFDFTLELASESTHIVFEIVADEPEIEKWILRKVMQANILFDMQLV